MRQLMVSQSIPRHVADEIQNSVQLVLASTAAPARPAEPRFPNSDQEIPTGPWVARRSRAVNGRVHVVMDTFGKRFTEPLPRHRDNPYVQQSYEEQLRVVAYDAIGGNAARAAYDAWMECDSHGNCPCQDPHRNHRVDVRFQVAGES